MQGNSVYQSISEVAALLNLPAHVLRFWETQFVQIKPVRRVGGKRFYRAEDVVLLQKIYDLLYKEGYTISGAQKYLKENAKNTLNKSEKTDSQKEFIDEMQSIRDYLGDFLA